MSIVRQGLTSCESVINHAISLVKIIACRDYEKLKNILNNKEVDVNEVSKEGSTALMSAAMVNDPEAVHILLEYGANPFLLDKQGKKVSDFASNNIKNIILEKINSGVYTLLKKNSESTSTSHPNQSSDMDNVENSTSGWYNYFCEKIWGIPGAILLMVSLGLIGTIVYSIMWRSNDSDKNNNQSIKSPDIINDIGIDLVQSDDIIIIQKKIFFWIIM